VVVFYFFLLLSCVHKTALAPLLGALLCVVATSWGLYNDGFTEITKGAFGRSLFIAFIASPVLCEPFDILFSLYD